MPPTIWDAARNGTLSQGTLNDFLATNSNLLDGKDRSTGFTLLGTALKYGMASAVDVLLNNYADANLTMGDDPAIDGRTPMYLAVTSYSPSPRLIQLLLAKKPKSFDQPIPAYNNDTPLMAAITQTKDPRIVKLLIDAGASPDVKNNDEKTARDLADDLADDSIKKEIKEALEPTLKKGGGGGGLRAYMNWVLDVLSPFNAWKNLGLIFRYASQYFYDVDSSSLHPEDEDEVQEPETEADFQNNLDKAVERDGLDRFFPPGGTYIKEVAKKAAALKNDPNNLLNSPRQVEGLATIALYQPVLYCDDSWSMVRDGDDRWGKQAQLVKRITSITNRAVPGNKGVHLRFINSSDRGGDNLQSDVVAEKCKFSPDGWTPIGTQLQKQILEPLIYSVINASMKLERPYLVLIITDGCPSGEENDDDSKLRKSILDCSRFLENKGYRKDAVRFCISQIGDNKDAIEFMNSIDRDHEVLEVLHRTSELLDVRFDELRQNEADLEDWLLSMLLCPVKFLKSP